MKTSIKNTGIQRNIIIGILLFAVMPLMLYVTGIGCPFKFATGISCPGCGMTRAWLHAVTGQLELALAYHPLFWLPPILLVVIALRKRMNKQLHTTILITSLALIVLVWIARLAVSPDSNMLFSCSERMDVVNMGPPKWLEFVCMHMNIHT